MKNYYLPEGVIVKILQRLPVKAILRCTCVSKSWYSLITSPEFISSHLNFTYASNKEAPSVLLRRCIGNSECYSLYSDDEFLSGHDTMEFPFRSINSYFTIIGSCHGLLCLSDDGIYHMHTIIIWNPCIRKSIILPKPNLIYNSHGSFVQCFGFGFDPISSDYKLVRITYVDVSRGSPQVEIYRLSTGAWQDISYLELDCVIYNRSRQAYVNGATHWIARNINCHDLILSFNMYHEVFLEMKMPASLSNDDSFRCKDVITFRDSLALISWNVSNIEPGFSVWVMKEYGILESWTKHFESHLGGGIMRPLWVRKHGEIVAVRQDGHIISYNPNGTAADIEDLRISGCRFEDYRRSAHVDCYMESLVLLGRGPYYDDRVICNMLPILKGNGYSSIGSYGSYCEPNSERDYKHNHGSYAENRAI